MTAGKLRVVIVDDSATSRAAVRAAIESDEGLEVVGEAVDGRTATSLVTSLAPDIVTMDVFLRAENGVDVAAAIMSKRATPIVIVTAADPRHPDLVFRAMQAGVVDVMEKLPAPTHPDYEARRVRFVRTVKTLATVPMVRRTFVDSTLRPLAVPKEVENADRRLRSPSIPRETRREPDAIGGRNEGNEVRGTPPFPTGRVDGVVVVGASTGGPPALAALLRALPKPFPLPIVVVQHMTPGFGAGFASWLADDSGHRVEVVESQMPLAGGVVYAASDVRHVLLVKGMKVAPSDLPPRGFHRPSVDVLFESAASAEYASRAIGVLLTGMGSDGARGLAAMRAAGAHTIAQLPSTCAVSSMPARAIELDAAREVLEPSAIPSAISARVRTWATG